MIQHCTKYNLLHHGQYGGVPGRDSVTPTIIKELQYKITRASKRPLIHLDYDATACNDRTVLSLSSLISRSYSQHRSIVFLNATTLRDTRYLLKTHLGVSEASYSHSQQFPIYGIGQGAGNSPAAWCVISSTLFKLYDHVTPSAIFTTPDCSVTADITMIGFVDDTSGSVNDFYLSDTAHPSHYIQLATTAAQNWHNILTLSGGALQEKKCSYHFMYYQFTPAGLPILQGGLIDPVITIQSGHNTR